MTGIRISISPMDMIFLPVAQRNVLALPPLSQSQDNRLDDRPASQSPLRVKMLAAGS